MHFCSYFHFFQIAVNGYHFWVVFTGEIIPMVKNTINSKKCMRAQALLGTFVHFCSYFPLFSIDRLWIPFLSSFWPWLWLFALVKQKVKQLAVRAHLGLWEWILPQKLFISMNSQLKKVKNLNKNPHECLNVLACTINSHLKKSGKYEQKSTKVPKSALFALKLHFWPWGWILKQKLFKNGIHKQPIEKKWEIWRKIHMSA